MNKCDTKISNQDSVLSLAPVKNSSGLQKPEYKLMKGVNQVIVSMNDLPA